jgi:hypothetical protein
VRVIFFEMIVNDDDCYDDDRYDDDRQQQTNARVVVSLLLSLPCA